ncbi:hypothetical protein PAL_GLEAN10024580 [Pteropus alecto]|uniref:Uncharacterized protein n=1 Tax=Pteropus alecto TaxID=9402 RepID=L5K0R2_PTEAL|nr:hypothetical protein PAL_GLEAN10024580 [Pteropus alecto]
MMRHWPSCCCSTHGHCFRRPHPTPRSPGPSQQPLHWSYCLQVIPSSFPFPWAYRGKAGH